MRAALSLALAMSAACARTEVTRVELGSQALDLAFVLTLDESGTVAAVSGAFGTRGGVVSFGSLPAVEARGSDRFVLLVLAGAALEASARGLATARLSEARLVAKDPTRCRPSALNAIATEAELPLPAGTKAYRIDEGALEPVDVQALATHLSLTVPVDLESCRDPERDRLVPFGATEALLPTSTTTLERVLRLDMETVLALAPDALHLFRRGEPMGAGRTLRAPPGAERLTAIAADRGPAGGPHHVVVTGIGGESRGAIFDVEVRGDTLRQTTTPTITFHELVDVTLDHRRAFAVLAGDGATYVRHAGTSLWTSDPHRVPGKPLRIAATGLDDTPHLIGAGEGFVHLGRLDERSWRLAPFWLGALGAEVPTIRGVGAVRRPGGLELWAAGGLGKLFRRPPGRDWEAIPVEVPPRYAPCAVAPDACGHTVLSGLVIALAIDPSEDAEDGEATLELLTLDCSAALAVRRRDTCARVLPAAPIARVPDGARLRAMDTWSGWLTLAGDGGRVYEMRLR